MRVVFVHGACVRDGSWWWHRAAAALRERGIGSVAPALPSCGEGDRPAGPRGPGLPEDVAAVRAAVSEGDEPIAIVAHSYGGIVAAEAAVGAEPVRHLVLVSSYLPEPGESLSTFGADTPPPFLHFDPDGGTFGARPEQFTETFVQDCPPDVARHAATLLVRQTLAVTHQPVRAAAWHELPTTYVVCTEDRGTPAAAQREFSRRADEVIEVKAGHHPFLSQPQTVADVVAGLR
ncbi:MULTISPECIES: alpha/beta hydrolase [Streptomyces]|uniref:Alpha/beta hydrolase n=2 Tax=Actinomycetes TaxID=1760 RepID=A0ABS7W6U6_STROV|nr:MULTISPECIES: alpha/beta hydrolase [Streptomyces]MBZ6082031.1 alpha/beta hydrolase [Streptomyces olivaceus]MBZ6090689.1 alpha/beta hydrolase [Streptomyces olivaceus]MBZ6096865.1 alpha/beta hydrolase [Streptomyces olivaceus]MBZ6112500.1 alpha/beta hydrolase [Streptomyces olivaceus]MBZ6117485.1 alpha/beta hydrolase [Streptomyces olivaceus]